MPSMETVSSIIDEQPNEISSLARSGALENIPNIDNLPSDARERSILLDKLSDESFSSEERKTWDKDLRKALVALQIEGALDIQNLPEDNKRVLVFDLHNLENIDWTTTKDLMGGFARSNGKRLTQYETLSKLSESVGEVYSKESFKELASNRHVNDEYTKPKKLFYIPDEDPFNPEKIKNNNCHLGLWEVCRSLSDIYPSSSKGSESSMPSVVLSALTYHKNWGNGSRDEKGNLIVTYPNGIRGKISGRFFKEWGISRNLGSTSADLHYSPSRYIEENCPELAKEGLLNPEDFVRYTGLGETKERLIHKSVGPKGRVFVDGVGYYIGDEYAKAKNISVTQISPEYACVMKNTKRGSGTQQEILTIFKLLNEGEKQKLISKKGFPYVTNSELHERGVFKPSDISEVAPELNVLIDNWKEFISFSNSLEDKGIPVVAMSAESQLKLWEIYSTGKGNRQLMELVSQSNIDYFDKIARINTLLALQNNLKDLDKILEISKNPNSNFLFLNMSDISEIISNHRQLCVESEKFSDEEITRIDAVSNMMLLHASKIFLSAYEVSKLKNSGVTLQDSQMVLYMYKQSIQRWFQESLLKNTNPEDSRYLKLLSIFDESKDESATQALVLSMIEQYWNQDIIRESTSNSSVVSSALDRIKAFYNGNEELFATSSETTGDTAKELSMLEDFFKKYDNIGGYVLDLGCGDGRRITSPMAKMLEGRGKVLGIDIWPPSEFDQSNLEFKQGSMDNIPVEDHSVDVVTLNWSPVNDWQDRLQQKINFREIGRVLKEGGILRTDQAYLEGGPNSWFDTVKKQFEEGSATKFGDMSVTFPGGRTGSFHIYPRAEFKAMLTDAGFSNIKVTVWYTGVGKPRFVVEAEYTGRQNPLN